MNTLSTNEVATLLEMFSGGVGIREGARRTGISKATAAKYFKTLPIVPLCGCGEPVTHQGWCKVRFSKSEKRQETVRKFRMPVLDELCENCDRQATHLEGGVPLCDSTKCNSTKQDRFSEKKFSDFEPESGHPPVRPAIIVTPPKPPIRLANAPVTPDEKERYAIRSSMNPKLEKEKYKFCGCGCGGLLIKDAVQTYLPGHRPEVDKVELKFICKCGCGTPTRNARYLKGHGSRPTAAMNKPAEVEKKVPIIDPIEVERVDLPKTSEDGVFTVNRKVTILIPKLKHTTQVRLTAQVAQALWDSMTKEERYDLLNTDDMWYHGFDDSMRIDTMHKVLLVNPEAIQVVKP